MIELVNFLEIANDLRSYHVFKKFFDDNAKSFPVLISTTKRVPFKMIRTESIKGKSYIIVNTINDNQEKKITFSELYIKTKDGIIVIYEKTEKMPKKKLNF